MGNFSQPFLQQDLIGNRKFPQQDRTRGFVFGHATGVNNTYKDLWEGPTANYVFPTSGMQMAVVSTSASDAAAGIGLRTLHIHYLDTNYKTQEESITLNGTTPVNTVATNIYRINNMHAETVGSSGYAVGNVSLTNTGGTVTYGIIMAGSNSSHSAIYTVPAGVTGYISHWQASSGSTGNHFCQIEVLATCHDDVIWPGTFLTQDIQGTQNGGVSIEFPIPIPIPEKTDVKMRAISDAANAGVNALGAIMGWFETN